MPNNRKSLILNLGKACEGDSEEKGDCTSNDLSRPAGHPNCVIHGAWTAWSAPSTCNSECKATKTRTCTNPEPINDSDKCIGDASQTGYEAALGVSDILILPSSVLAPVGTVRVVQAEL